MGRTFHKNTGECHYINNWIDYLFESNFITSIFFPFIWDSSLRTVNFNTVLKKAKAKKKAVEKS